MGKRREEKTSQAQERDDSGKPLANPQPQKQRTRSDKSESKMGEPKRKASEAQEGVGPQRKRARASGWKEYLKEAGLYDPETCENPTPPSEFDGTQQGRIARNYRNGSDAMFRHIAISDFNLQSVVAESKKAQPPEAADSNFETENEASLQLVTDQNAIIYDSTGNGDPKKGEILAIKVGTKMNKNPGERDTAIPPGLLSAVTTGLYHFLSSEPKTIQDNTRHTSTTKAPRECRPEQPIPEDSGSCINIHAYCTGRQDNSIEGIQLSRGPREVWRGAKVEEHLMNYLKYIKPLTQLTEAIFRGVLPEVFHKYKLVYDYLRSEDDFLGQTVKSSFGIWTSRGAVLCAQTDVHIDLLDVPLGYCAIIPLGKFTGGHMCLPSLGIKMELQPGSILFLRSHLLPHYVGKWSGYRFSIVKYTRQSVFDYYTQETGNPLFPISDMPPWYQRRYTGGSGGDVGDPSQPPDS